MLKNINAKITQLDKLYTKIHKHADSICRLQTYDTDLEIDTEKILTCIFDNEKKLEKLAKMNDTNDEDNLDKVFEEWHLIEMTVYNIDCIIDIINTLINDIDSYVAQEIQNIHKLYNSINKQLKIYKDKTEAINIKFTGLLESYISQDIDFSNPPIKKIDNYTELVKKYPFSVDIYASIVQVILQGCIKIDGNFCDEITKRIESVKDYIILDGLPSKLNTKSLHTYNPHIKTFGLTPADASKPLEILTNDLFSKSVKSSSGLTKIADAQDVCILILNRVIDKPIEFKLWNLIDWDKSKNFTQPELAGVNQMTIEKYNTIQYIPIEKRLKWDFSVEHYGKLSSEYMIVFERLALNSYRLLNLYNPLKNNNDFSGKKKSGGGVLETKIHRNRISELIEFVKNSSSIQQNTRISEYHNIQENILLKNAFLDHGFDTSKININSQIIESNLLRHELFIGITKAFDELLKKEFKDGKAIKTNKDLAILIHHKKILDVFNSIIIEQYDKYNQNNDSSFPFSEIFKSFLSYLSILSRNISRDIHSTFVATKINSSVFEEDELSKRIFIKKMFEEIIKKVLEKSINDKRNVYQSLLFKNKLLELSIY